MGILDLAGVALAALLSENFVLVNCMGIGTRVRSFRDPMDALRTGYCLTVVMVLGALFSWLADYLVFTRFGLQYYRLLFLALLVPGLVAVQRGYSLPAALLFSFLGGVGATVATASFASLREEVSFESCPRCFRGLPILFITAGLMALALVGFYGLHLG